MRADEPGIAVRAAEVLRSGGVVLFPTDTLYCLGADALSDAAVEVVRAIKGRDTKKPIHALVSGAEMAGEYGMLTETAAVLLAKAPLGKVSLVVDKRPGFETGIMRGLDTFGFRIPDHPLCLGMLEAFGSPITATSANVSNRGVPTQGLGAILAQLGPAVSLIDLAIDGGPSVQALPSTVIDARSAELRIVRPGAVDIGTI